MCLVEPLYNRTINLRLELTISSSFAFLLCMTSVCVLFHNEDYFSEYLSSADTKMALVVSHPPRACTTMEFLRLSNANCILLMRSIIEVRAHDKLRTF